MARRKIVQHANVVTTFYGVPDWTPEKIKEVSAWLRRNARWLEKHQKELGPVFRCRHFDR